MGEQLSKVYEPKAIESQANEIWFSGRYFHAEPPSNDGVDGPGYTIVIPPPNVTGALHMGHALNIILQDILIRAKRMQGFNTLWMPGTDHAGIATQSVVEKKLLTETGQTRYQVGREKLVQMIWDWKNEYGNRILEQLKSIGASCDWERTRFTLDDVCAKAVRHTFVNLFKQGLIYRGKRLVNWDPVLQTAVADDEVEHRTVQGNFYYIKYPLVDDSGFVIVATTRPETMLGDTAVAINPKDKRASKLVGKMVELPLTGRNIEIIADDYVKRGEGTGFLKVTPAHDPNDYEIGLRHNLEMINILTPDAKINENGGKYAGLDRYEARKAVLADLQAEGLIEKIEPMEHEVGHSDRSSVPVEPYLSDQWFIKVEPLAKRAIEAVEKGQIKFHPERYRKTYLDWLYGIRDWCISRQLWWGHRIPIWYCQECGQINTGIVDPTSCEKCVSVHLVQDPDVLDTWFSSALWPHSTMGWPEETDELRFYYPTDTLVTSRDIITLWVSRMVMMSLHNTEEIPFRHVFIHGKILDGKGETMSKSKGNGIDPLDIIDTYGADAMRFGLAMMTTESQDMRMPVKKDKQGRNISEKFDIGRNFCNKLWNASRFALMNLEGIQPGKFDKDKITITDKWILSRLAKAIAETNESLDEFKCSEPLTQLYRFFWNDFCDWYLEWIKPRVKEEKQRPIAQNVLAFVLDQTLRLLHPFVPFITEGIFQKLNEIAPVRQLQGLAEAKKSRSLVIAEWPKELDFFVNEDIEKQIAILQSSIRAYRDIKSGDNIPSSAMLGASARVPEEFVDFLNTNAELICHLARVKQFAAAHDTKKPENAATAIVNDMEFYLHIERAPEAERTRLEKQKLQVEKAKKAVEAKLADENFVTKAKPEVVAKAREKLAELTEQLETIEKHLAELNG
jgi:valyl-tRNA synthetase